MNYSNTIAAIATSMSSSGIGIIRISGNEAFEIIDKIFKSKKGNKKLSLAESHKVYYGYILDENCLIDEVLVLIMRGPNSYTGENTVEINCHGGILVMRKILETVIKNGASLAEPGEFTKRAFLNGRIDLSQAEAVIDVINAKNDYALKSSVNQMTGHFSKKIKNIRDKIIYQIAFIESALDDPEHVSLEGYQEELFEILESITQEIDSMLKTSKNGRVITEGIKTVILGKPNVGKSTLMNLLVGEERAIVTDVAGTTRDTLEEQVYFHGISLNIIDTAGIRETEDVVEKIGVSKAKAFAKQADLIIFVVDASLELDENDRDIINRIKDKKAIVLLNKTDLNHVITAKQLEEITNKAVISVSAKENKGIDLLENMIKDMFFEGKIQFNDEVYLTNIRHENALKEAYKSLDLVKQSIMNHLPEDFYSIDLMDAYEQLGYVIGEAVEEDLVNQIFSKFCMGK